MRETWVLHRAVGVEGKGDQVAMLAPNRRRFCMQVPAARNNSGPLVGDLNREQTAQRAAATSDSSEPSALNDQDLTTAESPCKSLLTTELNK